MKQQDLFTNESVPRHINLFPDFLSEAEEAKLLQHFNEIAWENIHMHGVIAKRKVAHFGLGYAYTKRSVAEASPAPPWMDFLTAKVAALIGKAPTEVKEFLVTYYPAGSGIGWHKDAEVFGDAIIGVSFLSDCTMKFRHPATKDVVKVEIPRRSAYVFSGDARWLWHHTIASHSKDRYSITFRTLRAEG